MNVNPTIKVKKCSGCIFIRLNNVQHLEKETRKRQEKIRKRQEKNKRKRQERNKKEI